MVIAHTADEFQDALENVQGLHVADEEDEFHDVDSEAEHQQQQHQQQHSVAARNPPDPGASDTPCASTGEPSTSTAAEPMSTEPRVNTAPEAGSDANAQPEPSQEQQTEQTDASASEVPAPEVEPVQQQEEQQQQQQQEPEQPAAPTLTPEQEQEMLQRAEALKQEGNRLYGEEQYEEARDKYCAAIEAAPPGAKQASVYFANLAAIDLKQKRLTEAAQNCSAALELDPTYVKALMRRGGAFEELDDLDHALADARKVVELDAGNAWATKAVARLEPLVAERHEKLKEEMLGKLKDLGNTILGKFGLSLDNFKAEKDPATGGYSLKFG